MAAALPDVIQRLRAWSYRRQQLGRAAADVATALRGVVAVYSSHPTAPLALQGRSASFDADAFRDLEERRAALRIPAMRESIFLTSADTAPLLFAATRLPLQKHAWRLHYAGLNWEEYAEFKQGMIERLQEPVPASALQQGTTGEVRQMTALRVMTYEGLVLRLGTSLRSDSLRYVATEAWLGHPLEEADPEESLRWLADAYLRGYGPARVDDFAWWTGVPRRRAAAAIKASRTVDVGGGLLLPADLETEFEGVDPIDPDAVDVLPKWDAYTMGHAPDGRHRLLDPEHLSIAYSDGSRDGATSGDGYPLILRGGRAFGRWSHRFKGKKLMVEVTPFDTPKLPPRIRSVFDGVGSLMGASAIDVSIVGT